MKTKVFKGFLVMLAVGALAAAGPAQVTVTGAGDPAVDVPAVQAAVDNFATVNLQGTFNFGPAGSVTVSLPGRTIQGVGKTTDADGNPIPATRIIGGSRPFCTPVVANSASNLTIRNIAFEANASYAVFVTQVQPADNLTLIEENLFQGGESGIHVCHTAGSIEIRDNILKDMTSFNIETHDLPLPLDQHVIVSGNSLLNIVGAGISVGVWNVFQGDRDHGPVFINDNYVHGKTGLSFAFGITTAYFSALFGATNNAVVQGNVLAGSLSSGIAAGWYGRGRRIVGNDLSACTTWQFQIALAGRDDIVTDNILGRLDIATAKSFGVDLVATGIGLWSNAPLAAPPIPGPTTNNISTRNDFRLTGLPGWGYDPVTGMPSGGCILVASAADIWTWFPANEVTNNLVKETGLFPRGTGGPKQQILEIPVMAHDNRIVGHSANEFAKLEAANPGIGQKIKEAGAKYLELLAHQAARIMELRKKEGEQ